MTKSRTLIVEPLSTGYEHSKFNFLIVSTIVIALGADEQIEFWADKQHCAAVKQRMQNEIEHRIIFREFPSHWVLKSRKARLLLGLVILAIRTRIFRCRLIFLSTNSPVILLSALMRSVTSKVFLLHSYTPIFLDFLSSMKSGRFATIFERHVLQKSLFVSLRQDVVPEIKKSWNLVRADFIDHPIGDPESPKIATTSRLRIGFLGRGLEKKGFPIFQAASRQNRNDQIEFIHLGPGGEISEQEFLSDDEFDEKLRTLTHVFYANDREAYKHIASGVVFDAIENSLSLIGIRDTFIEYLEDRFSSLGRFSNDSQELTDLLEEIESDNCAPNLCPTLLLENCQYNSRLYVSRVSEVFGLVPSNV